MTDHSWRNLAEDAINDIFKQYVGEQLIALIRQQIGLGLFAQNVTAARDHREAALEAISTL